MIQITTKFKQQLKAKAHRLKPIIFIGNKGLSQSVINEINRGLEDHELIKIRIQETDRELRRELFNEICLAVEAHPVQLIGSIGVIYKESEKKD